MHTTFIFLGTLSPAIHIYREVYHMVFVCHQLAFVLVMALFKTARCFVTPDLDFRGEGEDDGEMETLIISLEMGKRRHPLHKFSPLSFIESKVVFTATIIRHKIRPVTQSPTPHLSVLRLNLSGDVCSTVRIALKRANSR